MQLHYVGVQDHISYYLDLSCCKSARAHCLLAFHWFFICRIPSSLVG